MTTSTVDVAPPRTGYLRLWLAVPGTAVFLVFAAVPVSLAVMLFLCVIFLPGAGLALIAIGLPVMAFGLYAAHVFAELWARLLSLTGLRAAIDPVRSGPGDEAGRWGAALWPLKSTPHWLSLIHGVVIAPAISVMTFGIATSWLILAVGGTTHWLWSPLLPDGFDGDGMLWALNRIAPGFAASGDAAVSLTYLVIGGFCLITLPLVLRGLALLHRGGLQAMLSAGDARG